ncbi:MAG TPA: hypothetical protein VMT32_21320, partial [Bryobacteraceae bacterium]|nr:hypothetical protein [Bryobacteraceae bacterium]
MNSVGAAGRAFTIPDLYRVQRVESLSLAPNGKVVFSVQTSDLRAAKQTTHVWMMDAGGGNAR